MSAQLKFTRLWIQAKRYCWRRVVLKRWAKLDWSCLVLKTICVGPTWSTYILWEGPLIRLIFEFETMQFISCMNSRTHRNSMPKSARKFCFKKKFQMPKACSSSLKLFSTLPVHSPLSSLPTYHQAIYKGNLNVTLIIISSWIRTVSNEQAKY